MFCLSRTSWHFAKNALAEAHNASVRSADAATTEQFADGAKRRAFCTEGSNVVAHHVQPRSAGLGILRKPGRSGAEPRQRIRRDGDILHG